jgi:DMSO/TMAO reductase YedYZ molybdopterin-dependent catalytic subunit
VLQSAQSPQYLLTVVNGDRSREFTLAQLSALPQTTRSLPIACVEGWSANGRWTGVMLSDLVATVGASGHSDVRLISLEPPGPYSRSVLPAVHARDSDSLIALKLNGETLTLDHGYPCRLITASRPGVLQTKWLSRIEVVQA